MERYLPKCIIAIVDAYYYPKRKYKCVQHTHSKANYWTEIGGLCHDNDGIYLERQRSKLVEGQLLMYHEREGTVLLKLKDTIVYCTLHPKITQNVVAHYTYSNLECYFEDGVLHFPLIGDEGFSSNTDQLIWCVGRFAEARIYSITFSKQQVELIYVTNHDIEHVLCSNNTYLIVFQNYCVIRDKRGQCHELPKAIAFDVDDDIVVTGDAGVVLWFSGIDGKKLNTLNTNEHIEAIKLKDRYTYIWFYDNMEIWHHETMTMYSDIKMPKGCCHPHFTSRGFMVHTDETQFYYE